MRPVLTVLRMGPRGRVPLAACTVRRALRVVLPMAGALIAAAATVSCGEKRSDFVIRADSIAIAATQTGGATVHVSGWVGSGCDRLKGVQRWAVGDSLFRLLVGEHRDATCTQMLIRVSFDEEVAPALHRRCTVPARCSAMAPSRRSHCDTGQLTEHYTL